MAASPGYLQPQAALEAAVRDAIRTQLGYAAGECDRAFDGRPPPRAGLPYAAVWSPAGRGSESRTALDERFKVSVTVTLRMTLPFDRRIQHRDDLEARVNAIRALVHRDCLNFSIANAANVLAGYRPSAPAGNRVVGFCEGLMLQSIEDVREVGGEWFHGGGKEAGVAQTAHFGRARHVQAIGTAT